MMPLSHLDQLEIILGSGSPRRRFLLEGLGLTFRVMTSMIEEQFPHHLSAEQVPVYLSEMKSRDLLDQITVDDFLLITADTVVVYEGSLLGKPSSIHEAKEVLQKIAGQTHEVITGVTLATNTMSYSFSATTLVTIAPMTKEEIEFYVTQSDVLDKAGSYGIQDWIGLAKVTGLVGSYFNVMGLPTDKLYEVLSKIRIS